MTTTGDMGRQKAMALCSRWLPLWTGNRPEDRTAGTR
jgi:hypothetical protein